jgi:predicted glycosyltransferase
LRVLIDIKHPAEANFFRPLIRALLARGDGVLVTAHYKPEVRALLDAYGIEHVALSKPLPTHGGIVASALWRTARMVALARWFRPQIMVARVGAEVGLTGRILGIPAISYDENERAGLQFLASVTLAHRVCTGMGYEQSLGPKQLTFNSLPQLVYTHPARFTPDPQALRDAGIEPSAPYVVLRMAEWTALHDIGHRGMSDEQVLELAGALSRHGRVLASRPAGLSPALAPYAHRVPPDHHLDLLAFARLYVGEGGSMAAEAACLGTPAIFANPIHWGYLSILTDKYGLIEQVTDPGQVRRRAERWLTDPALRRRAERAHQQLLADSEDGLQFMLDVVDRYARRR